MCVCLPSRKEDAEGEGRSLFPILIQIHTQSMTVIWYFTLADYYYDDDDDDVDCVKIVM